MKRFPLLFLCAVLLVSNACERHPVSDLKLIEGSEGVPEPKQLPPPIPAQPPSGESK